METGTDHPPLDYHRETRSWWRRWWKTAFVASLSIGLALLGWSCRDQVKLRARQMYWERQCAEFVAARDEIRFATKPQEIASVAKHIDYANLPASVRPISPGVKTFQPYCWRMFAGYAGARDYYQSFCTVFLHGLRAPSGALRIVHVEALSESEGLLPQQFLATVIEPPTLLSAPVVHTCPLSVAFNPLDNPATLLVGQPDANDPTHFTIEFTKLRPSGSDVGENVIDGYLNDNNYVTLRRREPSTEPVRAN